ncbi:hypothetical protein BCR43DRAFT_136153 [Syncephalastrum racemosum]|uniref:Uncharacterized protein n=1 Tax=Syncephalastrum racemosum TaxID=13706 RepID=A0A1X2HLP2_SYNRA|nr:hypothetical protein BCR43DRAFT_136153 [Syncephalastrum racemosum]
MSNCFLRMGTNAVENAKTVLDFAMLRLQQDEAASSALFAPLGPAAVFTARPWAMLLVHDRTLMEQALAERRQSASADRPWLDAMQICQIDTIHQLRGILCTLHVSIETKALPRSIISWIQHKKDGQPPCLIVVTDLLGLLITSGQDTSIPEPN